MKSGPVLADKYCLLHFFFLKDMFTTLLQYEFKC